MDKCYFQLLSTGIWYKKYGNRLREIRSYLLFIVLLFFLKPVALFAQSSNFITAEFKQESLWSILKLLEENYELKFSYDVELVSNIYISKSLKEQGLGNALNILLDKTGLEYRVIGEKDVLIRRKKGAQMLAADQLFIQSRVTDAGTGAGLPYATILIPGTKTGTVADSLGFFSLRVPDTVKQFRVSYLGYIKRLVDWPEDFKFGRISLQQEVSAIPKVLIEDSPPPVVQQPYSGALIMNFNGSQSYLNKVAGADVLRSLQLLPGISANDDFSSELRIRGSGADENIVLLDGITLYNVNHYFGIFSIANPSIISEAKVYKNSFPIEYGGRTSGVVELNTAPLESRQIRVGGEVSLLTAEAYTELPLGKNMGLLLGGRFSHKNLGETEIFKVSDPTSTNQLNKPPPKDRLINENPDFSFYDFNAKWEWKPAKGHKVIAHWFQGQDQFEYTISRRIKVPVLQYFRMIEETYEEESVWENRGLGIQSQHNWSERFSSEINLVRSEYKDKNWIESELESLNTRSEDTISNYAYENKNDGYILSSHIKLKNTFKVNPNSSLIFGMEMGNYQVDLDLNVDRESLLTEGQEANEQIAFVEYQGKALNQKLYLSAGLRANRYSITERVYTSPRLNLGYHLSDEVYLKASASRYYQYLKRPFYEDRLGREFQFWILADDERFPISRADQYMLGFRISKPWLDIDVEFYQKETDGILELAQNRLAVAVGNEDPMASRYSIFTGRSFTQGIDVLLRHQGKAYGGWIAYTLSKTTNSFDRIFNGAEFPGENDRRHQLKWVNQLAWNKWTFSFEHIFASGRPYTDLARFSTIQRDREEVDPESRIDRLPSYYRMDIGLYYDFKLGSSQITAGASVFNLLDRQNVKYQQYLYAFKDRRLNNKWQYDIYGTTYQMLGRTFNLSLNWHFR